MQLRKFATVASILFSVALGSVWSEPEKILSTGSEYEAPAICIDNEGIAWIVASPWSPQVFRFADEQTGWEKVTECYFGPLGSSSSKPRVCFDKDGILWVLVYRFDGVYYRCFDGDTWTEIDTVPTNIYWSQSADITADSSGGIWVGWTTEWGYYWWDVGYNRYKDGTWGEPRALTDTLKKADNELLSMTTDAYGRVWFGWTNAYDPEFPNSTPLKAIYNENGSWSDEHTIWTKEGVWGYGLDLMPDSEGGIWALWYCGGGLSVVLASYWDGETWSEPDTVAGAGGSRVKIAVDAYGNAWAVWRQIDEDENKYGNIYYSVNSGSGWSEPEPVSDNPAADNHPDIAVDGAGRIWCAWVSTRDGGGTYASYTTSVGVGEAVVPAEHPIEISTSLNRLSYDVPRDATLSLYSADGRLIFQEPIAGKGTWVAPIGFPSGVYFVRVQAGSQNLVAKFVMLR